ncbi:hypothetical protein ACW2QC_09235 [Virgibacillus sp. FSP13]
MPDALQKIQLKIENLENKVKELRADNKKWRDKFYGEQKKVKRVQESERPVNPSEIEKLEIENGRLRIEINQLKRDWRAEDKLKEIERILKR